MSLVWWCFSLQDLSITVMTAIIDEVGYDQSHFEFETGSNPDEGIFIRTVTSLILPLVDVIHVQKRIEITSMSHVFLHVEQLHDRTGCLSIRSFPPRTPVLGGVGC